MSMRTNKTMKWPVAFSKNVQMATRTTRYKLICVFKMTELSWLKNIAKVYGRFSSFCSSHFLSSSRDSQQARFALRVILMAFHMVIFLFIRCSPLFVSLARATSSLRCYFIIISFFFCVDFL